MAESRAMNAILGKGAVHSPKEAYRVPIPESKSSRSKGLKKPKAPPLSGYYIPVDDESLDFRAGKVFAGALKRAFTRNPGTLTMVAERLIAMAMEGDLGAIKEISDRLDGKAIAQIEQKTEHSFVITVEDAKL